MMFFARRFLCTALLWVAVILVPHQGIAAGHEKELKQIVQNFMDDQAEIMEAQGITLLRDGSLMVEDAGDYYAVTLPFISTITPDGIRTDYGIVTLNMLPAKEKDQWKFTMALPMPIITYNKEGQELSRTTIGTQSFGGIWHAQYEYFLGMNIHYENIAFETNDNAQPTKLTVPSLALAYNFKEDKDGTWSGPYKLVIHKPRLEIADITTQFENISLDSTIDGLALEQVHSNQKTLIQSLDTLTKNAESSNPLPTQENITPLYNTVFSILTDTMKSFQSRMTLNGLSITLTKPETESTSANQTTFALQSTNLFFGMDGFDTENAQLHTALSYAGLNIPATTPLFDTLLPKEMKIDLTLDKLPLKKLGEAGRKMIETAANSPDTFFGILSDAQTQAALKNSFFKNDNYEVTINGAAQTNQSAARKATAHAKLEINGIDKISEALQQQVQTPETATDDKQKIMVLGTVLGMVKMMGTPETNAQGASVNTYNLALDKEGKFTLNNTDISLLLGQIAQSK